MLFLPLFSFLILIEIILDLMDEMEHLNSVSSVLFKDHWEVGQVSYEFILVLLDALLKKEEHQSHHLKPLVTFQAFFFNKQ